MNTRVTEGAQRSRTRALHLLNLKKKRDCSQSILTFFSSEVSSSLFLHFPLLQNSHFSLFPFPLPVPLLLLILPTPCTPSLSSHQPVHRSFFYFFGEFGKCESMSKALVPTPHRLALEINIPLPLQQIIVSQRLVLAIMFVVLNTG